MSIKVRTAMLKACFAHTGSLSLIRECKLIYDRRERVDLLVKEKDNG